MGVVERDDRVKTVGFGKEGEDGVENEREKRWGAVGRVKRRGGGGWNGGDDVSEVQVGDDEGGD